MIKDKSYRQIVFLSGKGGTGKTTFTAAFAKLLKNKIVIDCDVDAANLYLLLKPSGNKESVFIGCKKAAIDLLKCTGCGLCEEVCRFDAIKNFVVDQISCEGCGFCVRVCPDNAISFEPNISGIFFKGKLEDDSVFFHARLNPGEGNSGKLVTEIKKEALTNIDEKTEWILIDGPPGIGCPVNASLAGSDFVVLIAEATLTGLHDLKRLIELLKTFKFRHGIIINKYDLNEEITRAICDLANDNGIEIFGLIAFNPDFVRSLQLGKTIIEHNPDIKTQIEEIWSKIKFEIPTHQI
ncbi:MAG: ATP-binding protein [Ignavibacteriaceae bacterium]|nr:ATP-binding protein [Ignavibacteriaceae bacterium]